MDDIPDLDRSREEQFPNEPDECDHEKTRTSINAGGPNTETCHDCGRSWTPPRDRQ